MSPVNVKWPSREAEVFFLHIQRLRYRCQSSLLFFSYQRWLVGGAMCPSWKMMEFVNGKDDIPYMKWKIKHVEMENKTCSKPPTRWSLPADFALLRLLCLFLHFGVNVLSSGSDMTAVWLRWQGWKVSPSLLRFKKLQESCWCKPSKMLFQFSETRLYRRCTEAAVKETLGDSPFSKLEEGSGR